MCDAYPFCGDIFIHSNRNKMLAEDSMSEVADKVKKIIVDQLNVKEEDITPETTFGADLGADSLDQTEMIMALEEEFDIEIADEDAQKIQKVQDAIDYIEAKKQ